jgi:outer membrane autotransporter protein
MTYGTVANVDFQPLKQMTIGVAGSWLATNVHWDEGIGGAHGNSAKAGVYVSYVPSCFFIDTLVSGGYTWNSARRHIEFPIAFAPAIVTATRSTILVSNEPINRKAHSHPNGYDVEAHFQAGYNFRHRCWWITPVARISYFFERIADFKESGANSLNLKVKAFDTQDLRTYLGFGAAYSIDFSSVTLIPQLQAMWIYDYVFNDRRVRAGLENLDGTFSVQYFRQSVNSFFGSAGLKLLLPKKTAIFAFYELELGHHFISHSGRLDFRISF